MSLVEPFDWFHRSRTLPNLKHLIEVVESLQQQGVGFKSLEENIDTTSSTGRLIFHLFCSLAEFERQVIRERTVAGLRAARTRGRKGGRRPKLTPQQIEIGKSLAADPKRSVQEICQTLSIGRMTYYRYIYRSIES